MDESTIKLLDMDGVFIRLKTWVHEVEYGNNKRYFGIDLIEQGYETEGGWVPPQQVCVTGKANLYELARGIDRLIELYEKETIEHE